MWGTGKTHVAAAVALAASTNLPQKEQRHGRMSWLRKTNALWKTPLGMRFGQNRCCDHFWISLKTGDNATMLQSNMMNHDIHHDIYNPPEGISTWGIGTGKSEILEILQLSNYKSVLAFASFTAFRYFVMFVSRNASCVSHNPMQRQLTYTNDWRLGDLDWWWIPGFGAWFCSGTWDMSHLSYFFLNALTNS